MLKYEDRFKVEWVANRGSIHTKDITEIKIEFSGKKIKTPIYIAFNIGEAAEHIVRLHNASLKESVAG